MPYFTLSSEASGRDAVTLYFEVHGTEGTSVQSSTQPKVCMLMGFGAPGHVWSPQLADLLSAKNGAGPSPMAVCVLDNRGVGQSSSPKGWRQYSTDIMAQDTLTVMDHLGWPTFHLIGHSMGSMIAAKVAAAAPQRVLSLSLISSSGGQWQAIPQSCVAIWLSIKKAFVRSVRRRAAVDVQFHFSPSLLREVDPVTKESRREVVIPEYVEACLQEEQEQPGHGALGQLCAVMRHRMRKRDVKSIQLGQFPVLVIHGRQDIIALPKYGEKLAARLQAPCILLEGGHFVIREQAAAVNEILRSFVLGTSFASVERYPYMPFQHWVSVVEQLREQRINLASQRNKQPQPGLAESTPGLVSTRSWPLGIQMWRLTSNDGQPA